MQIVKLNIMELYLFHHFISFSTVAANKLKDCREFDNIQDIQLLADKELQLEAAALGYLALEHHSSKAKLFAAEHTAVVAPADKRQQNAKQLELQHLLALAHELAPVSVSDKHVPEPALVLAPEYLEELETLELRVDLR